MRQLIEAPCLYGAARKMPTTSSAEEPKSVKVNNSASTATGDTIETTLDTNGPDSSNPSAKDTESAKKRRVQLCLL